MVISISSQTMVLDLNEFYLQSLDVTEVYLQSLMKKDFDLVEDAYLKS